MRKKDELLPVPGSLHSTLHPFTYHYQAIFVLRAESNEFALSNFLGDRFLGVLDPEPFSRISVCNGQFVLFNCTAE